MGKTYKTNRRHTKRAAKHSTRRVNKKRSNSRSKSRGGGAYPESAWGYELGKMGDGWTQYNNSLTLQPGQNLATRNNLSSAPIDNVNANAQRILVGPELIKGGTNNRRFLLNGDTRGLLRGGKGSWYVGGKKSKSRRSNRKSSRRRH